MFTSDAPIRYPEIRDKLSMESIVNFTRFFFPAFRRRFELKSPFLRRVSHASLKSHHNIIIISIFSCVVVPLEAI